MEGNLFNAGIRPAINVGISVSRVGGNAQIKSMKKVAGTLKLDQALYREMEAFSKFGGDLDAATKSVLDKGARNVEILKQPQFSPYSVEKQVAIIYLGTHGLMSSVPVKNIQEFEEQFLLEMENKHPEILAEFKKGNLPEDGIKKMAGTGKRNYAPVSILNHITDFDFCKGDFISLFYLIYIIVF